MFIPKPFNLEDYTRVPEFISKYPLGTFISSIETKVHACHLPFITQIIDGELKLYAHLANQNIQSQFLNEHEHLVIFQGLNGFISSELYEQPDASTWNYQSIHIYGTIKTLNDEELFKLLKKQNVTYDPSNPHHDLSNLPQKTIDNYLKLITGFELTPIDIQINFKLSQNRKCKDQENVIQHLKSSNNPNDNLLAEEMSKFKKHE